MHEGPCSTPGCDRTNLAARGLCRLCYNREWKAANPGRMNEYLKASRAADPGKFRASGRAQYAARRAEMVERKRKWAEANREKARASSKRWREENPEKWKQIKQNAQSRRRARKRGAERTFTTADWRAALKATNNTCFYCRCANEVLQQEHMVPLARGGTHTVGNVVPACVPCNAEKGTMTTEEYLLTRQERNTK